MTVWSAWIISCVESAPTEVELFANITNVSFSDVENLVATEVSVSLDLISRR